MADEKPIRALADDDPRRQRYAELLAQAGRMSIPRLHPGDANSVMSQLATMLGAPVLSTPLHGVSVCWIKGLAIFWMA